MKAYEKKVDRMENELTGNHEVEVEDTKEEIKEKKVGMCINILILYIKIKEEEVINRVAESGETEIELRNKADYRNVSYIGGLTERINRLFNKHGFIEIKLVYKPTNKIRIFMDSMKDVIAIMQENDVVYRVNCKGCPKIL